MALAEVYEVATFYAHFDVVKEGETPPPAITVRVCDSLSCAMAGAEKLLPSCRASSARMCASCARPAWAPATARRSAPSVMCRPSQADADRVAAAVAQERRMRMPHSRQVDFDVYRAEGGYALLKSCLDGRAHARRDDQGRGRCRSARPRRRGLSRPDANGPSCAPRRGPRLMAVNGDEGEPGTFKDRYYLGRDPHRFIEGMLIAAWVVEAAEVYFYLRDEYPELRLMLLEEIAKVEAGGPVAAHHDPSAPRRRRLHLRRRIRDDRIDRGQARPAAPSPALCRAGRRLRPPDARAECRDAVLDPRHRREGRDWFTSHGRRDRKGFRSLLGVGPREESGREARARRHHDARTDRRILRRHAADGHSFKGYLPGGASGGILPASWPTSRSISARWSRTAASSARMRL